MTERTTAHPTGDHWIAPHERALFGSPPQPPKPLETESAPAASGTVAFDALRAAAEAAAAAAELLGEEPDDGPELTLVHGHEIGLHKEGLALLHELTLGDEDRIAVVHVEPHVSQRNDSKQSLLKTPVGDLIARRRHEVAS